VVRGETCKPIAESPAVAPPLPTAFLSFPYLNVAIADEEPEADALLNLVINLFDEELLSAEPFAFLIPVCK
jgi:hypothetical protein